MIVNDTDKIIIDLLLTGANVKTLRKATGLTPSALVQRLNTLKNNGYLINKIFNPNEVLYRLNKNYQDQYVKNKVEIETKHCFKYLVISDTHITRINSKMENIEKIYEYAENRKINYIFHLGDLLEGIFLSEDDKTNLSKYNNISDQINYLTAAYPKYDDINTLFILGNHDGRSVFQEGIDISRIIENRRMDMHFLGYKHSCVKINNRYIGLHHPNHCNHKNYDEDLIKEIIVTPDIILRGHLHKKEIINKDNRLTIYVPQTYDTSTKIAGAYEINMKSSKDDDDYNLNEVNIKPLLISDEIIPYMEITEHFSNGETPKVKKYENMSQTEKFNSRFRK